MQLDWWRSKSIRSGHYGYHRYFIKLYVGSALVWAMCGRSSELGLYLWGNRPLPTMQGLPPLVGGGCAPEQWVSPIVRSPQEVNPSLRGTFCCPQVVGGYQAAESYKSLQCIIQRADNFDKLLWQSDY